MIDLDTLARLAAAATNWLPLTVDEMFNENRSLFLEGPHPAQFPDDSVQVHGPNRAALAAYIVAACNAVPELVDVVAARDARIAELESALASLVIDREPRAIDAYTVYDGCFYCGTPGELVNRRDVFLHTSDCPIHVGRNLLAAITNQAAHALSTRWIALYRADERTPVACVPDSGGFTRDELIEQIIEKAGVSREDATKYMLRLCAAAVLAKEDAP